MKKISNILSKIFSIGVLLTLFAGALAGLGFIVAFIIGGETATELCVFIHKQYFPIVIQICSVATGCGLLSMYLGKEKALSMKETK